MSTKIHSSFCSKLFTLLRKTAIQGKESLAVENILVSRHDNTYIWDNFGSCLRVSNEEKIQVLYNISFISLVQFPGVKSTK